MGRLKDQQFSAILLKATETASVILKQMKDSVSRAGARPIFFIELNTDDKRSDRRFYMRESGSLFF